MNKKFFSNKTILITGASSGLGSELCRNLSILESNLIIVARRKDKLDALKEELRSQPAKIFVIEQDLTSESGPENIYQEIRNLSLSLDILINNAGFALSDEFMDFSLDEYMNMVDLNIKAVIKLIYLFLPEMQEKRSGAILNVSSVLGVFPTPDLAVYSGTKGFILNFSEALWKEMKRYNVSVTTLVSVGIETEFFNKVKKSKFRYLPIQKPEVVAKKALTGLSKRKRIAYTGNRYAFLLHARRILPQRFVIWLIDFFYDKNKVI